jgi:hypothetical protein
MYTDAARNNMIGAEGTTHISAHSAYSATGANELTGGSPAYARKAVSFGAAAAAAKALSASVTFDIPAAATVRFIGRWTAITAGTFLGMEALGGNESEFGVDLTADTVIEPGHGRAADSKIVFYGDTVPTGLTEGTVYFVRNPTTDTYQVGATAGGAAINLTGYPSRKCVVSTIVEEAYGSQGTLQVTALNQRCDA